MASNCSCKKKNRRDIRSSYSSVIGAIIIALIPKCPFCILAYSSAITMCSGKTIYDHTPVWTSYISIGLSVFTLAVILFNYKGLKTIVAAGFVVLGSVFLGVSEMQTGSVSFYYTGAVLLMFGVWLNANFMYFYHRYFKRLIHHWVNLIHVRSQ